MSPSTNPSCRPARTLRTGALCCLVTMGAPACGQVADIEPGGSGASPGATGDDGSGGGRTTESDGSGGGQAGSDATGGNSSGGTGSGGAEVEDDPCLPVGALPSCAAVEGTFPSPLTPTETTTHSSQTTGLLPYAGMYRAAVLTAGAVALRVIGNARRRLKEYLK